VKWGVGGAVGCCWAGNAGGIGLGLKCLTPMQCRGHYQATLRLYSKFVEGNITVFKLAATLAHVGKSSSNS
jgi:hypothetical protein